MQVVQYVSSATLSSGLCVKYALTLMHFYSHASEYVTVQRQAAALVHNGKRPLWGHLTATQSYLCFGGDLFGQPTRFAFHFSKIKRLAERDGCESSGHERAYLEVLAYPQVRLLMRCCDPGNHCLFEC